MSYKIKKQSTAALTHNFEVRVGRVTVHHRLCLARVAAFMPNLDILYSQVTSAIFVLRNKIIKKNERRFLLFLSELWLISKDIYSPTMMRS